MNLATLLAAISSYPRDTQIQVVGHGRLHNITHAYVENGGQVLLLYVEGPEPAAESPAGSDVPGGAGGVSGGAASVASHADRAGTLHDVRTEEAPVAVTPVRRLQRPAPPRLPPPRSRTLTR